MTITVTPIQNNQTFGAWLSTTNRIANIISQNTVTSDSSTGGSLTTGNVYVNGHFGAGYLFAETALIGGNVSSNATLNVLANVNFTYSSANLMSITANSTTSNLAIRTENTAILGTSLFINATINAVSSANLAGAVSIANTLSVANVATFSDNINVENVIPLVSGTFDLGSTTNLFKNTYTQTVLFATGSANGTQYTGTANNSNNLDGQTPSFYTNATNITTGTLSTARLPATVNVTTLNASTVNTVSIVANGTTGTAGQVLSSNGTGIYWSSVASGGVTSVASGNGLSGGPITSTGTLAVVQGTGTVVNATGVHVNATYIGTLTANNSTNLNGQPASFYTNATNLTTGTVPTARLPISSTSQQGIVQLVDGFTNTSITLAATANSVKTVYDFAAQIAASGTSPGGSNTNIQFNNSNAFGGSAAFTFNNATNTVTVGAQLSVGANASLSTSFLRIGNSSVNTAISAGAITLNGVNVNTAITGNASTAYTNAINIAANATNLTSGTVPAARLSGSYTIDVTGTASNALNLNGQSASFYTNATNLATGTVSTARLATSGTANTTTFLRGDRTWATITSGGVTSVATGNGITGGTITSTGTLVAVQGTGTVVNTTGIHVNSSYIATIAANSATGSLNNTFTIGTGSYFVANGNVGIGNTTPAHKLRVQGNLSTSGNVEITATGRVVFSGGLDIAANSVTFSGGGESVFQSNATGGSPGTGGINLAAGGTSRFRVTSFGAKFLVPIERSDGSSVPPSPTVQSGIGQWVTISSVAGNVTLPSGGTWAWFVYVTGTAGINSGGSTIATVEFNGSAGFAWRIF